MNSALTPRSNACCLRIRKAPRLIFCLGCFLGFIAQLGIYVQLYYKYQIRIEVETVYSNAIEIPAVTICNNNRYRSSELRRLFKTFAEKEQIKQDDVLDFFVSSNESLEVLMEIGHQFDTMMELWNWKTDIELVYTGSQGNCFLLNGNISGAVTKIWHHHLGTAYNNVVVKVKNLQPTEYIEGSRDEKKVVVAMHNSKTLLSMEETSSSLYSGQDLVVLYSKVVIKALPPPFRTKCKDFTEEYRKNDFTGPLSKRMCEYRCFARHYAKFGVFPMYSYQMTYPFPPALISNISLGRDVISEGKMVYINYIWSLCAEECPIDCTYASYDQREQRREVSVIRSQIPEPYKNKSIETAKKAGVVPCYLIIQPMGFNYQTYNMKPLIQGIEVLGHLGGSMGMWLGISLFSTPRLVGNLARRISVSMEQKKSKPHVSRNIHVQSK